MPMSGKVWIRPKVTTNTTIGASNGELVALDQGTFVVDDIQVTKALYGGYVKLSEESMDMTSPEVLGALIDDMARVYANETDIAACATFAAESLRLKLSQTSPIQLTGSRSSTTQLSRS